MEKTNRFEDVCAPFQALQPKPLASEELPKNLPLPSRGVTRAAVQDNIVPLRTSTKVSFKNSPSKWTETSCPFHLACLYLLEKYIPNICSAFEHIIGFKRQYGYSYCNVFFPWQKVLMYPSWLVRKTCKCKGVRFFQDFDLTFFVQSFADLRAKS